MGEFKAKILRFLKENLTALIIILSSFGALYFVTLTISQYLVYLVLALTILIAFFKLLPQEHKSYLKDHSVLFAAFSIIATVITFNIQIYREDYLIKTNLFFENSNNFGLHFGIEKNGLEKNYEAVYLKKFNVSYSKQYPHYNVKLTEKCVADYNSLMSNFELANTVIDEIRNLKQEAAIGNSKVNDVSLQKANKELIRYSNWIRTDMNNLENSSCRTFPKYSDWDEQQAGN